MFFFFSFPYRKKKRYLPPIHFRLPQTRSMLSYSDNAFSSVHQGINLGCARTPWKKIWANSLISVKEPIHLLQGIAQLPEDSAEHLNILNCLPGSNILLKAQQGSILLESNRHLIQRCQNAQTYAQNRIEKLENNFQVFARFHEITCQRHTCRATHDITLQSHEGKIMMSSLREDQTRSIEIQAPQGGIQIEAKKQLSLAGDTIQIAAGTGGLVLASHRVHLGAASAPSETIIHGNLQVKGKLIFNDDIKVEKHVTSIKRFENVILLHNNDSDFGFFSQVTGLKKGLIYSTEDDQFFFSDNLGSLNQGRFSHDSKYANLRVRNLIADNVECKNSLQTEFIACQDTLRTDKVYTSKTFTNQLSCSGIATVATLNIRERLLLDDRCDVTQFLKGHVGDDLFFEAPTTLAMRGRESITLQPGKRFCMTAEEIQSPTFTLFGQGASLYGSLRVHSSHVVFDRISFEFLEIDLTETKLCEFRDCSGVISLQKGNLVRFRRCNMDDVSFSTSTKTMEIEYSTLSLAQRREEEQETSESLTLTTRFSTISIFFPPQSIESDFCFWRGPVALSPMISQKRGNHFQVV